MLSLLHPQNHLTQSHSHTQAHAALFFICQVSNELKLKAYTLWEKTQSHGQRRSSVYSFYLPNKSCCQGPRQMVWLRKKMVENSDGCVKGSAQQVRNCIRRILKSADLVQCMCTLLVVITIWAPSLAWWYANCSPMSVLAPISMALASRRERRRGRERQSAVSMWLHVWSGGSGIGREDDFSSLKQTTARLTDKSSALSN